MTRITTNISEQELLAEPLADGITAILYSLTNSDAKNDKAFQDFVDLILKYKDNKEVLEALKIYASLQDKTL